MVEHAVKPLGFLAVSLDGVGDLLGRVLAEMVVLTEHRPEPRHLPMEPLQRFVALPPLLREEAPDLVGQVFKDGARFEERQWRAAVRRLVVKDGRDAVVGCHLEELGRELFATTDIDRLDLVGEPRFLQEDRDLVAVGRGPIKKFDHSLAFPYL